MTEPDAAHHAEDEAQRAVIREALGETLFVEAGAGTGKTRALVDRVVSLILDGRPVDRIIAITFTEKAAAELRDRVRAALEEALTEFPDRAPVIQTALDALDRAQISTIHAFGMAQLRFFAAEAGIDPDFRVLDELQTDRRLQERWRVYLEGLAGDKEAVAAIDRALALGLTTRDIAKLARDLASRPELAARLEERPPDPGPADWPDVGKMQRQLEALPLASVAEGDSLRRRVEGLLALVRRMMREGADRESMLASGYGVLSQKWGIGRQDDWGGREQIQLVRETASEAAEQLTETLAGCRAAALASLLPLIVRFVREDMVARGKDGTLTFDDLILGLRDLLQASPAAARAMRERYDALLIDEFQDTDPLQVDIALAFATDPESGRLEPGRLFLVGDPKQSIYRFRRADMAIYSRTRSLVEEAGGRFPGLSLNRRSRHAVLDWVNQVFSGMIGEGENPNVQPPYHPIHSDRFGELRGPGVGCFGGAESGKSARDVRRLDARAVAAHCLAALEEGWQVMERDGTVRDASLRDIAILIPSRAILGPLERALADAGIPFRVEGGSLIYRTQEVRDLINCLTSIDDPADEVATVGALRSVAFACSDVDLALHRAEGGSFNYLAPGLDERDGPVAEGLRVIKEFHLARHDASLASLVERFVADRGLVDVGILVQADRNSFRRMRFMVEQARAFEEDGPESLRAFVTWMERRASEAMLDHEGGGLDDDEDAVRVLTIHGAKGLEFPIVFVAGLGTSPSYQTGTYGVDYAQDQVAVRIGAKTRGARFEVGPVQAVDDLERAHTDAEACRMLYVACTRARDHLVVSLYHPERAARSWARRLLSYGASEHGQQRSALPTARRASVMPFSDLEVELSEGLSREEFRSARTSIVAAARRQRYTSATALGPQWKEEATDESEPWSRGRGGTRVGRAVHAAVQGLPWDADDSLIAAFARAQAVAEAIPERAGEVERLVKKALQSEAADRARSAARALREVPFALSQDGTILEGFVDLVIETDAGLEIVDWKTDDVPRAAVAERLREYELQAGLYVLGIETATGRSVNKVTYVFVRAGLEASPGEPPSLRAAALSRLHEEREAPR